jgi:hypothetical protein
MNKTILISFILFFYFISGCSSLTISPVDFSWPVERVLKIDAIGSINEERYSFSIFILPIFLEERGPDFTIKEEEVRVIRDMKGYYYFVAESFNHVYVFELKDGELSLFSKILVSENGMVNPAFNQRQPYIELLYDDEKINLTPEAIVEVNSE